LLWSGFIFSLPLGNLLLLTGPIMFLRVLYTLAIGVLLFVLSLAIPVDPGRQDGSRVLLDAKGGLVRVWLDAAGQYRFPADGRYSPKYYAAVTHFEDRRFAWHPGIDVVAVGRAVIQNLRAGRVVSGASTLTMQAARLRNPRARTWWAKLVEAHTALRMEWQWGKHRVFAEYASRVPMGGNVVGVETACWRFFGHSSAEMTWAEAALLALLPNRPSALNLERSRDRLLQRRDRLLRQLAAEGLLDSVALATALAEPLPTGAAPWRFRSPHYAEVMERMHEASRMQGTLDPQVQETLERIAALRGQALRAYSDLNMAVLIVETQSGKVRGYLGSMAYYDTLSRGMVDGVLARRSTGSTLKPFLYGLALARGPYTPATLLEDVPAWYGGFSPQNADLNFSGLVPMREALARSLNVPAVRVLSDYGVEEFYHWLKGAGLGGLFRTPEGYGLPLILGGAEASLAELVPLYAMLLRDGVRTSLVWTENGVDKKQQDTLLPPAAAYQVRDMLTSVLRPDIDMYHAWFDHQVPVAWKTGTSYGSRDGWAIGANSQWTIGVWVGNFRGGEVPGLSGGGTAAPLLFSLFNALSDRNRSLWPPMPPVSAFQTLEVCDRTGYPAGTACPRRHRELVPREQRQWAACPYHKAVILSRRDGGLVHSGCWDLADTVHGVLETWPAAVRAVWRQQGQEPPPEPVAAPACASVSDDAPFSWIYPAPGTRIYLPRDNENSEAGFIARVAHRQKDVTLYWFLDGIALGETTGEHKIAVRAATGEHRLVAQDSEGRNRQTRFSVRRSDDGP
jgi:penicillin-binding protein 1C